MSFARRAQQGAITIREDGGFGWLGVSTVSSLVIPSSFLEGGGGAGAGDRTHNVQPWKVGSSDKTLLEDAKQALAATT